MKHTVTERGFVRYEFTDSKGQPCWLQESSSAEDQAIWFGQFAHAMHLTREQLEDELLTPLTVFVATGRLPEPEPEPEEDDGGEATDGE